MSRHEACIVLAICMALMGCEAKTNDAGTPLPLDSTGKPMQPKTPYEQWLTDKPAYFNLSDQLQLAIPPKYQRFWVQKDIVPRRLEDMEKKASNGGPIAIHFFMPDFSGYTPGNYDKEFHPDHVYVLIEAEGLGQEQPGAPGRFPENMYQRLLSGNTGVDMNSRETLHDMDCYRRHKEISENQPDSRTCYGIRNDVTNRMIQLNIMQPPYPDWVRYPLMQAAYFSADHGGTYIIWRTHMKHFPKWKEIDQQIWRWIAEWNLVKPSEPSSPASVAPQANQPKSK